MTDSYLFQKKIVLGLNLQPWKEKSVILHVFVNW